MMHRLRAFAALALATACVGLAGCSEHAAKTAERSASPLLGTWTRDGGSAGGHATAGPQFTKLTFAPDGSLDATYAAQNLGTLIGSAASVKTEHDTYAIPTASKLSIAEGTRHLGYTYQVSGSKLYLTPLGGGDAAVFTKAG
jgi:hypothetical protein